MPISSLTLASAIQGQFMLSGFVGRDAFKFAQAVGSSVSTILTRPNAVSGFVSGTAGVTGNMVALAPVGVSSALMSGLMFSKGVATFTGRDYYTMCSAVAKGICLILRTSILTGKVMGVGPGAGIGKFLGIAPAMLFALILPQMSVRSFLGLNVSTLADAIAFGVVMHLLSTVTFTVTSLGAPAPVPPTGPVPVVGIKSILSNLR